MKISPLNWMPFGAKMFRNRRLIIAFTAIVVLYTSQTNASSMFFQSWSTSINAENVTVEVIFKEIESTTPYRFLYHLDHVDLNRKVSVYAENDPIKEVLRQLFRNTNIDYLVKKNQIILRPKIPTTVSVKPKLPVKKTVQQQKIIGFVYDENSIPLSGVTVLVKGTQRGVVTNFDGNYAIEAERGEVLVFSYLGYLTQEITVDIPLQYNVSMKPSSIELEGVTIVSTGYQKLPKERVTGSFETVSKRTLKTKISQNLLDKVVEEVAGIQPLAVDQNGRPVITVRGQTALNAGTDINPLIVVDGIPLGRGIGLDTLNPNDVESVTLLKDAAAASIWGIRAANGVIVVTTKKGNKNQKPVVDFSTNLAITPQPDLFGTPYGDSETQIDFQNALIDIGLNRPSRLFSENVSGETILQLPAVTEVLLLQREGQISEAEANTRLAELSRLDLRREYTDLILRPRYWNQYNLSLSAGGDKSTYRASLTYNNNKDEQINTGADQVILNIANTVDFSDKFKTRVSLNFSRQRQNLEPNEISPNLGFSRFNFRQLFQNYSLNSSILDQEGNYVPSELGANLASSNLLLERGYAFPWTHNIRQEFDNADNTRDNTAIRALLGFEYEFLKGLTAEVNYQYEWQQSVLRNFYNQNTFTVRSNVNSFTQTDNTGNVLADRATAFPVPIGGILDLDNQTITAQTLRAQLNYVGDFNDGLHKLNAIAGYEVRKRIFEGDANRRYGFDEETLNVATPDFNTVFASNLALFNRFFDGRILNNNFVNFEENRFLSYYGNASYTYNNNYTLSFSSRLDDTNVFARTNSQRNIPTYSVGLKWDVDKDFFKDSNVISRLSIRGTYGINGNVNFNSSPLVVTRPATGNTLPFNQLANFIQNVPNPDLRLERTKVFNLRADFSLFNDIISGSLEYYNRNTIDILADLQLNPTLGVGSTQVNNGEVVNSGTELTLRVAPFRRGNFKYTTTGILSINKSEITKVDFEPNLANLPGSPNVFVQGTPFRTIFAFDFAGLDRNGAPQFFDENRDIVDVTTEINNTDALVEVGSIIPTHFGSWINEFEYKNLSLRVLTTFRFGHVFNNILGNYTPVFAFSSANIQQSFANRWRNPGDENFTNIPALPNVEDLGNVGYQYHINSDVQYDSADVIRLRQINLNYALPQSIINKIFLNNLTVGFQAENIAFKSFNKWNVDPDNPIFPLRPTFTFNISGRF